MQEDCLQWENRKFRKDAWQEIAGLVETAFQTLFVTVPKDERRGVSLFIRERSLEYGNGCFDFMFKYDEEHDEDAREYPGRIQSIPELTIRFSVQPDDDEEPVVSGGWAYWGGVPVRSVYNYLESIGFYDDQDKEPVINPDLKKDWTRIYYRSYPEIFASV